MLSGLYSGTAKVIVCFSLTAVCNANSPHYLLFHCVLTVHTSTVCVLAVDSHILYLCYMELSNYRSVLNLDIVFILSTLDK